MKPFIAMVVMLSMIATGANAQTPKQKEFLAHIAMAKVLEERCVSLKFNDTAMVETASQYGVNSKNFETDNRLGDALKELYIKSLAATAQLSLDEACNAAMLTYGWNGSEIKNLLVRKDDEETDIPAMSGIDFLVDAKKLNGQRVRIRNCLIVGAKSDPVPCEVRNNSTVVDYIMIDGDTLNREDLRRALHQCAGLATRKKCRADVEGTVYVGKPALTYLKDAKIHWKP